jgi:hypothetical protein
MSVSMPEKAQRDRAVGKQRNRPGTPPSVCEFRAAGFSSLSSGRRHSVARDEQERNRRLLAEPADQPAAKHPTQAATLMDGQRDQVGAGRLGLLDDLGGDVADPRLRIVASLTRAARPRWMCRTPAP